MARCLGNLEVLERVVSIFQTEFTHDLDSLEALVDSPGAGEQIARVAHRMKGASANVAANKLNRCVAEIEQLARKEQVHELRLRLERLREEWGQFTRFVDSLQPWPPDRSHSRY